MTGEIGTGKTTLCRCLVEQLPPDTDIALILNPRLTAKELLETVCDELRIERPAEAGSIKLLIDALNRHLLQSHSQRRRTVLIIDEAQNLDDEVLEQIRLLTNLETSREKLLQIILIGQPELLSILKRPELRQLAQRITARYHLQALSRRETHAYIRHRLSVAGRSDPLFTKSAMRRVCRLSGGMPRLINIICDRALLGAYTLDKRIVGAAIVRRAGSETQGMVPWYRRIRMAWAAGILALAAVIAVAGFFLASADRSVFHSGPTIVPAVPVPDTSGVAAAKPQPVAVPATKAAPPASRLADILADPVLRGEAVSSFVNLYNCWGARIAMSPSDYGCKVGRAQGFECLFQAGSWTKLRRFNLPAILEVTLPNGQMQRVTLIGLSDETARLAIGNREYAFPISEIDTLWDGSFILVWKPPFRPRQLSLGAKGEEVAWVRRALDRIEGKKQEANPSDDYDENLRQRVRSFQRQRSLIPDGYVGSETLVHLAVAAGDQKAPSIVQHSP